MLLHRLTSIFSRVVWDHSSNGIFGFAISCKMAKFSAPESLYGTFRSPFPGWGRNQCGNGLVWGSCLYWALFLLRVHCAPRHKLFFCPGDFGFCQSQFSLANLVGLSNIDLDWSRSYSLDWPEVFFKFQSCFTKAVFKPQSLLKIWMNPSHDEVVGYSIQHFMVKLLLNCCEICKEISHGLGQPLAQCLQASKKFTFLLRLWQ